MISLASHIPISLLELAAGPSLSDLLDGLTKDLSELDHALASHIRQRASKKHRRTKGISGHQCLGSSESQELTHGLESKLQMQFGSGGSMEYSETWRQKATPAGRLYWVHTASARRTSDKDCIGWPSPQRHDAQGGKTQEQVEAMRKRTKAGVSNLNEVCMLTGWGSPRVNDGTLNQTVQMPPSGTRSRLELEVLTAGWNTPRATDGSNGGPNQSGGALPADAAMAGWQTPNTIDAKGGTRIGEGQQQLCFQVHGTTSESLAAQTENRGVLEAAFSRWLMGFPASWDEASPNFRDWCDVQDQIAQGD